MVFASLRSALTVCRWHTAPLASGLRSTSVGANVCHRHTAPPNGHPSMSAWLVARGNQKENRPERTVPLFYYNRNSRENPSPFSRPGWRCLLRGPLPLLCSGPPFRFRRKLRYLSFLRPVLKMRSPFLISRSPLLKASPSPEPSETDFHPHPPRTEAYPQTSLRPAWQVLSSPAPSPFCQPSPPPYNAP